MEEEWVWSVVVVVEEEAERVLLRLGEQWVWLLLLVAGSP